MIKMLFERGERSKSQDAEMRQQVVQERKRGRRL